MSTTTRKPLEDCALTAATKLPAAPETSTSMAPSWSAALSNARLTASKSRTSAVTPTTLPPVVPSAAVAASTLSCLRLATDTLAPCFGEVLGDPEADAGRAAEDEDVLSGEVHRQRYRERSILQDTVTGSSRRRRR